MPSVVNVSVRLDGHTKYRLADVEMNDEAGVVVVSGFDPETRRYGVLEQFEDAEFQWRIPATEDAAFSTPLGMLEIIKPRRGCCR